MSKKIYFTHDDYWAIWIGGFLLLLGLGIYLSNQPAQVASSDWTSVMEAENAKAPFKTIEWYEASDQHLAIKGSSTSIGKLIKKFTGKPGGWSSNPATSFITSASKAEANQVKYQADYEEALEKEAQLKKIAFSSQSLAALANFQDDGANDIAVTAIDNWRTSVEKSQSLKKKLGLKAGNKLGYLLILFAFFALLLGGAKAIAGIPFAKFLPGFALVFGMGVLAYFIAGQADLKAVGLGYAIWAIIFGLLISNTVGVPEWVKPALATEYYIKIGLVLLGAEILLSKVLAIGLPGIFVAWVVTPIVLVSTYWFGQKVLKIKSKSLNMVISADMSVCGVSAAVATAAASNASKEELTLAVGLSMVFTSVMMVVMPTFINWVGIPEILGGAWMGGTIDATGAVVAAGAFLGDKALSVAATIKMIQNILIGVIAFGVAVYFTTKVNNDGNTKIGAGEIWRRFPKFIIGFLGASILFSLIYSSISDQAAYSVIEQGVIGGFTKNLRGWFFCLAFVSIGLSTNFKELKDQLQGGKPLLLYLIGQTFNLCLTLAMAYLMFYVVFDGVLAKI